MSALSEELKPWAKSISAADAMGDKLAGEIIDLYDLHRSCPNDPAAVGLCRAALKGWLFQNGESDDQTASRY